MDVTYADMPEHIKGLTLFDLLGNYSIILNSKIDLESQRNAYQHEMNHINNGDTAGGIDYDTIELCNHSTRDSPPRNRILVYS